MVDVARRQLIVYIDGKEYQRYPCGSGPGQDSDPHR